MKVLFVIRELYGGGAERALSNIMVNLPDDWEIELLMNNRDFIEFPYKGKILSLDIGEPRSRKSIIHQLWAIIKRTWYLKKIKKENNYDACISFLDSSNISNVLSGNKYCKTIVSIRSDMTSDKNSLIYKICAGILIKFVYNRADKIVAVSREIESNLIEKFQLCKNKITSIANGYNVRAIREQSLIKPGNSDWNKDKRIVVTVGRLNDAKGQWHLIRSFVDVVKKQSNAMLLILGTGELEKYLKDLIKINSLENNVYLIGYCNNPFYYDANADIFVLPSMYEGFPNALAEAVCCGAPCIATDFHSGAREILAPNMDLMGDGVTDVTEAEYGILTPLCSGTMYKGDEPLEEAEEKLAEAILMLLEDKKKNDYYRKKSVIRSETLGIDSVIQQWIKVIEE